MPDKPIVVIESPFRDGDLVMQALNRQYARRCVADSLRRGEAPFASHLLYTQYGVLRDSDAYERCLGIYAGLAFLKAADLHVFYTGRGMSEGMKLALRYHVENCPQIPITFRDL
jgi:hypothetical protein